jgi:hypothetical protein
VFLVSGTPSILLPIELIHRHSKRSVNLIAKIYILLWTEYVLQLKTELHGYCFQYPVEAGFRIHDVLPPGIAAVCGPPLTPNFEPIRADLTVYKQEPANDCTLDEVVATVLTTYPEAQVVDTAAAFAGEPAQVVEGISGMMDSRRYYLIHNDFVYEITLAPLTQPGEFEEAVMAQRELL